jgi:hypothetical protein
MPAFLSLKDYSSRNATDNPKNVPVSGKVKPWRQIVPNLSDEL